VTSEKGILAKDYNIHERESILPLIWQQ